MRFTTEELRIDIEPWGPDEATVETARRAILEHQLVRERLRDARHRLLTIEPIDDEEKTIRPTVPRRYLATLYDYTNNRALLVHGQFDRPGELAVVDSGSQPLPSREEFDEAVELLAQHRELGEPIRDGQLVPYAPMPPLVAQEEDDGHVERTIAVGLRPVRDDGRVRHEIVGVNLIRREVIRYAGGAPDFTAAHDGICGLPNAGQGTAPRTAAGTVRVTVRQGATVLWRFVAIRPAASAGVVGSGIELRFVDYRGKRVLYRANVPILNVRYDGDACGPYRDWQYEEGRLEANGTDVAPGFRFCPTPARTILDTNDDTGNFLGVAIYVAGQEVVLVCEMQAGWYRYISEWRFHTDGTIRPRFGFSAVQSSCVCERHYHHVYWRFDFDIRTAGANIVREFNDPPLVGGSRWHAKSYEIRRLRDLGRNRRWRVEHAATGEGYTLVPGPGDGTVDSFGVGDLWALRYCGSASAPTGEGDDGQGFTTDPARARAGLDRFLTGESIHEQDVVLWYAAHFSHDVHVATGHIVGPDLVPVNW